MIIVRITGGLGNQMFQYAFARALQAQGKKVMLHWHGMRRQARHNGLELDGVFELPLSAKIAVVNDAPLLNASAWWMRKTARRRQSADIGYAPDFLELKHGYLDGYWQTARYFETLEERIRADFRFRPVTGKDNLNLLGKLASEACVSIHVRRGDYLTIPGLGEVCTPQYYQTALARLDGQHPAARPVVFSDDIPFCRELLAGRNAVFVDWNRGPDSWMDMALMSRCRHHIIANSSFSWWGAWLDASQEGVVIAPSRWFAEGARETNPDIYPAGWIRL